MTEPPLVCPEHARRRQGAQPIRSRRLVRSRARTSITMNAWGIHRAARVLRARPGARTLPTWKLIGHIAAAVIIAPVAAGMAAALVIWISGNSFDPHDIAAFVLDMLRVQAYLLTFWLLGGSMQAQNLLQRGRRFSTAWWVSYCSSPARRPSVFSYSPTTRTRTRSHSRQVSSRSSSCHSCSSSSVPNGGRRSLRGSLRSVSPCTDVCASSTRATSTPSTGTTRRRRGEGAFARPDCGGTARASDQRRNATTASGTPPSACTPERNEHYGDAARPLRLVLEATCC